VAGELYTAAMMSRRIVRITAYVLIFLIGTLALEGYDVLSGANITSEHFYAALIRCFG
jgi:hypothetical protein